MVFEPVKLAIILTLITSNYYLTTSNNEDLTNEFYQKSKPGRYRAMGLRCDWLKQIR